MASNNKMLDDEMADHHPTGFLVRSFTRNLRFHQPTRHPPLSPNHALRSRTSNLDADTYFRSVLGWALRGARRIGSPSAMGQVFTMSPADATEVFSKAVSSVTAGSLLDVPRGAGAVVVKLTPFTARYFDWEDFMDANVRETHAHMHLASGGKYGGPGMTPPPPGCDPSSVVPAFYAAGVDTRHGVFITVMEAVGPNPVTLYDHLRAARFRASPELYVRVEHAVVLLWLAGVAHGDLHENNVLVVPGTGVVKVIDFGFAVKLPHPLMRHVRGSLHSVMGRDTLRTLWRDRRPDGKYAMGNYVNTALAHRGYQSYNPDKHLLDRLYSYVPASERDAVKMLRPSLWQGCSAAGVATRGPSQPRPVSPQSVRTTRRRSPPAAPATGIAKRVKQRRRGA